MTIAQNGTKWHILSGTLKGVTRKMAPFGTKWHNLTGPLLSIFLILGTSQGAYLEKILIFQIFHLHTKKLCVDRSCRILNLFPVSMRITFAK